MTQLQSARGGRITAEMRLVARKEGVGVRMLREGIAAGRIVIPANRGHRGLDAAGIGSGLRMKVNANIGASQAGSDIGSELKKLQAAVGAGADAVMDLSTSGDADSIRRRLIRECRVPFGTVPIYQAAIDAGDVRSMGIDGYMDAFRRHARDGVDFATVHAGVTRKAFPLLRGRLMKCVSRGGSFLLEWMRASGRENFLYEHFGEILEAARKHDITLSLGDGLRPGCLADATDRAQLQELGVLAGLAGRAREAGVQVMIEGPGHIPLNEIGRNVSMAKRRCGGAPLYLLGPLPTDTAAGYDHIACAIGGALAGWKGADFLCYVTPKEHIGLPDVGDVREGVIAARIAAHIADVARGHRGAVSEDLRMARAREKVDWEGMQASAIDRERFGDLRKKECERNPKLRGEKCCSMCGPFCVFRVYKGGKGRGKGLVSS